jgi:hypothetical protein
VSAQGAAAFPLELTWNAPAECGSAEQVRAELERIARVRPGLQLTKLAARAEVERRGAGFAVALYTEHEGESGERRLEAADCRTLVRTVTLVLALAFGAGVEVAEEESAAGGDGGRDGNGNGNGNGDGIGSGVGNGNGDGVGSGVGNGNGNGNGNGDGDGDGDGVGNGNGVGSGDGEGGSSSDSGTEGGRARWALLIGGGAQFALMPSMAFAAALGAELGVGAFSIGLRATAWPGVSTDLTSELSARFDGLGGQLQACGHLPAGSLSVGLCADARAAAVRGRSDGALVDRSSTAPSYALGATAALTWPRNNWLSVRIEASLAASLNRPRFEIENFGPAHRVPSLLPAAGALLVLTP